MKITKIDSTIVSIPTRRPMQWSGGAYLGLNAIIVRIETDTGLVGYGECDARIGGAPHSVDAIVHAFAPRLVGMSPYDIEEARRRFYIGDHWYQAGAFPNLAFAGLEMALWDLIGKDVQRPVHQLLGGKLRDRINHFGYVLKGSVEEMAAEAKSYADAGFSALYVKVGYGLEEDLTVLKQIRAAIGPGVKLRIDVACEWDVATAVRMMRRFEQCDIDFLEQPVGRYDLEGHRELKNRTGVPIALNQSVWSGYDVRDIIRARAADIIVLGPGWAGGLLEFKKIAYMLELENISLVRYSCETGLGTCAGMQVSATIPNLLDGSQIYVNQLEGDVIARPSLAMRGGDIDVPIAPGLGVEIDEAAIARYHERFINGGAFHRDERPAVVEAP